MQHRCMMVLFAMLLPALLFAQDGKLRGKIVDKDSGEPLIGATVVLEGTSLGASSDVNGEYVVLTVPPGVYSIRANYIGYAPYTISNVRVNANQTTTQDFRLTSSAVQVGEIQVVAERPLIQRNTTNTVRLATQEDLQNLPVRGVQNVIALQAGVVEQNNNLYVRGGRAGEVAYYVDGAPVTNPLTNTAITTLVPEAIEELQLQAGGYTAEYGGANSGIVNTTMRSGGANYRASVLYETDDLAKPGKEFLGTTNQGLRNVAVTFGGPFPGLEDLRFFAVYANNYQRNRDYIWLTPFDFSLQTSQADPRGAGVDLPGPVAFKENYLPNNYFNSHSVQGNMLYDAKSYKLRFTGSYEFQNQTSADADWDNALVNVFRQRRVYQIDRTRGLYNLKFTHALDANTYYEISGSYQRSTSKQYDPDFKDNWQLYQDSVANAGIGYTGFRSRYTGPSTWTAITDFAFRDPNSPNNAFVKQAQESFGGSADFVRQMSKNWELKVGGRYDRWTMRYFSVGNISSYMTYTHNADGSLINPATLWSSDAERAIRLSKAGTINYYGYDIDGNEISDGTSAPFHPTFLSAYVQNKFEYQDFVLNAGLRFEYFKGNSKTFPDPTDPTSAFNQTLDVIDQSKLVDAPAYKYVLPRLSFSFPVTANTVFYAQYGKYVQMPDLNLLYVGNSTLSRTVSPNTRGNAYLTPVGYLLTPQRSTQYEMGIRQILTDNLAFTLSGFVKDLRDLAQVRNVVNDQGVSVYRSYQNADFGTVKGVELTLDLRRTERLSARVNYTLSDAVGTGSTPNSAFGQVEQGVGRQINLTAPLGFNQRHRLSALLDYRWGENEGGPVLSGLGANLLFTFNSGHPYTAIKPLSSLGQSSTFDVGVGPLQDPRNSYPIESINSSTTPSILNIDLGVSKLVNFGTVKMEFYVHVSNLLNTKQIYNVYPTTGAAGDDGWLNNPLAAGFLAIPQYADFYRAINLENRWAYYNASTSLNVGPVGQFIDGVSDIYGTPRQIRVGARLEL